MSFITSKWLLQLPLGTVATVPIYGDSCNIFQGPFKYKLLSYHHMLQQYGQVGDIYGFNIYIYIFVFLIQTVAEKLKEM